MPMFWVRNCESELFMALSKVPGEPMAASSPPEHVTVLREEQEQMWETPQGAGLLGPPEAG